MALEEETFKPTSSFECESCQFLVSGKWAYYVSTLDKNLRWCLDCGNKKNLYKDSNIRKQEKIPLLKGNLALYVKQQSIIMTIFYYYGARAVT